MSTNDRNSNMYLYTNILRTINVRGYVGIDEENP